MFDTLTVTDNLEMGGYLLPRRLVADRVEEVLTIFPKLRSMMDRTASKLSGGERKMVAVARVLMLQPSVLILDEPTSNLSIELSRIVLREQVVRLADAGVAVLLVEQKAIEALEISHWAYIMVAGQTRLSASAKEVLTPKRSEPQRRETSGLEPDLAPHPIGSLKERPRRLARSGIPLLEGGSERP